MILAIFTIIHVLISLVGIVAGFYMFGAMLASRFRMGWTRWFLVMTVATSVTGFMFPFKGFTPAQAFGVLSLVLLGLAIYGLEFRRLAGGWRRTFAITALVSQYLNVFVLVVQLFQKIPFLRTLGPTQTEPIFGVVQGLVLMAFVGFGLVAVRRFVRDGNSGALVLENTSSY